MGRTTGENPSPDAGQNPSRIEKRGWASKRNAAFLTSRPLSGFRSLLVNARRCRPSMVCGELANILYWQRPALIGGRLTPKVGLPNLANLLRIGRRTFDDNPTTSTGQRRQRTFPVPVAFVGPDGRRTRLPGGVADMRTWAGDGSDRLPFAARWMSANPAGRWRSGGLSHGSRQTRRPDWHTSHAGSELRDWPRHNLCVLQPLTLIQHENLPLKGCRGRSHSSPKVFLKKFIY
jgi:hypothetical protein